MEMDFGSVSLVAVAADMIEVFRRRRLRERILQY